MAEDGTDEERHTELLHRAEQEGREYKSATPLDEGRTEKANVEDVLSAANRDRQPRGRYPRHFQEPRNDALTCDDAPRTELVNTAVRSRTVPREGETVRDPQPASARQCHCPSSTGNAR